MVDSDNRGFKSAPCLNVDHSDSPPGIVPADAGGAHRAAQPMLRSEDAIATSGRRTGFHDLNARLPRAAAVAADERHPVNGGGDQKRFAATRVWPGTSAGRGHPPSLIAHPLMQHVLVQVQFAGHSQTRLFPSIPQWAAPTLHSG